MRTKVYIQHEKSTRNIKILKIRNGKRTSNIEAWGTLELMFRRRTLAIENDECLPILEKEAGDWCSYPGILYWLWSEDLMHVLVKSFWNIEGGWASLVLLSSTRLMCPVTVEKNIILGTYKCAFPKNCQRNYRAMRFFNQSCF